MSNGTNIGVVLIFLAVACPVLTCLSYSSPSRQYSTHSAKYLLLFFRLEQGTVINVPRKRNQRTVLPFPSNYNYEL